jgi:hypothetical protein
MSETKTIDLTFVARQLRQVMTDVSSMRDDMSVLTAIVMRQDGTLNAILGELRAMHSQHSRLGNRVRGLELRSEALV